MRVAVVVSGFPRLSETFILSQITGLIDCGHQVDIYTRQKYYSEQLFHADIERYGLKERTFQIVPKSPIKRMTKSLLGWISLTFQNPIESFRLMRSPGADLKYKIDAYIYAANHRIKTTPYDIIHCHFATCSREAMLLRLTGSPEAKIVTTFHGCDVNDKSATSNPSSYRTIFDCGELFTANTTFTAKKAAILGCPSHKITILPVGLDVRRYPFSPRFLKPGCPIKILTVGRLVEKKGVDYSIKAVSQVIQNRPDLNIEYKIVGDGAQRTYLEKLVQELEISNCVTFLGEMTSEAVREVYNSVHLFILASVTAASGDMEGQALVLQEAQCTGLPVISTIHNGIPDGVLDRESGFLVAEKDVDALADKIIHLADHPEVWARMGKAGHDFVKSRYDIRVLNKKLLLLYERLLLA